MDNKLVLYKVINAISGKELEVNRTYCVQNIDNFLRKFILNNTNSIYILYFNHNNTNYNFMVAYDIDTGKPNIYELDEIDVLLFETILKPMTTEQKINRIVKNANKYLSKNDYFMDDQEMDHLKTNLLLLNDDKNVGQEIVNKVNKNIKQKIIMEINDSYSTSSEKLPDQQGGIILALIENALDALPVPYFGMLFTGILEIIDLILMGLSAIPVVGVPFDILSSIFAILRGQFMMLIPILIGFIPAVGDAASTMMKLVAKVLRIGKKINKYRKKFEKISSRVNTAVDVVNTGQQFMSQMVPQMQQIPQMQIPQFPQIPQMPQMQFPQMQMPQMQKPQMQKPKKVVKVGKRR